MEINDVIKEVANMLQLSNVYNANFDADSFDAQTQRDINLIISCINEVLCDIATDYLPLKKTEIINVSDGVYQLSNLSNTFHKLISVNTKKPYTVKSENLIIESGTYELTYSFLPEIFEFGDTIEDFDTRLTLYALCFGVAAEYCLISGNYNESEMWNSRFENAMQIARRKIGLAKLKERRWI